jgi:uncharacterized membrane protein
VALVTTLVIFGTAFLGSAVESVEALTIVLAVGLTRGWRSPLAGAAAAVVLLAVLVATFGQLLVAVVPDWALKVVIGSLILLFGLRWLHKAVLRSAGVIALRDEQEAFRELESQLASATDWVGFLISFKGVFLEGLEVAFIVFGVGSSARNLPLAAAGGLAAVIVVVAVGAALRKPLSRVPENQMKYAVGVLLSSLGTFWAGEGMGVKWPFDFVAILGIAAFYLAVSQVAVALIRGRRRLRVAA